MDADVLCLGEPTELLDLVTRPDTVHRWNRDVRTSYSAPIRDLERITGLTVPPAMNAGFQLVSRFGMEDFAHLERMLGLLAADGTVDLHHLWSSQSYCALSAAARPGSGALPDGYSVTFGPTGPETKVRHFVGVPRVRPRFFTEGVARLRQEIRRQPRAS